MRISIVTPVRNGAATIRDCLDSVQRQTLPAEHIVVDGCSTDSTMEVVRQHGKHARVVSEEDAGAYDAMNKGIAMAAGDVIGILGSDDFFPHSRVLSTVAEALSMENSDSCYGDLTVVDAIAKGRVRRFWRSGPYHPKKFFWGWMPPHPTFFVRKSVYEKHGSFHITLGSAADYELMLRFLLKHGISTTYIPEVLVHMRSGGMSNSSLRGRIRSNLTDREAWRVNGLRPYPWTLWMKPARKLWQFVSSA